MVTKKFVPNRNLKSENRNPLTTTLQKKKLSVVLRIYHFLSLDLKWNTPRMKINTCRNNLFSNARGKAFKKKNLTIFHLSFHTLGYFIIFMKCPMKRVTKRIFTFVPGETEISYFYSCSSSNLSQVSTPHFFFYIIHCLLLNDNAMIRKRLTWKHQRTTHKHASRIVTPVGFSHKHSWHTVLLFIRL